MSQAPGHKVIIGERPAAPVAASSTATGFMVGVTQKGDSTAPIPCVSLADFVTKCGERLAAEPKLFDAADVAFREGASVVYVSRAVGGSAKAATKNAVDAASKKTLEINAKSPGAWGNNLKAAITLSTGKITIVVTYNGTIVETSPALDTNAEVVAWAKESSAYLTIVDISAAESAGDAKTQTLELAEGADDIAGSTGVAATEAALNRLTRDLGPGQVSVPGSSNAEIHTALLVHAAANNRRALLDEAVEASLSTLVTAGTSLRGANAKYGALFASWAIVPGTSLGTTRKVPWSAIMTGLIARSEAEGNTPNKAAAGPRGKCRYATGLVSTFTDAQRAELDDAGVTAAIMVRGVPTNYGNVTLVNQTTEPNWTSFSASRTVMAVAAVANEVLENYDFALIDGHGYVFKELQGSLSGAACMPFYEANALYGQTPQEAFAVNTGPDVNTPSSIAAEEIKAQIAISVSPTAQNLVVEVVKVPITESV